MKSVWEMSAPQLEFDRLRRNTSTEVLIIGGGITGVLCARALREAGVECIVAEANKICGSNTANTTAKLTVGHGLIYDKLTDRYGQKRAAQYLETQCKALGKYEQLCREIDCDFEKRPSYIYSIKDLKKLKDEVAALTNLGFKAELKGTQELPFATAGAVCISNQAQFNPLKFLFALAKELPIYEHTKVVNLKPHRAITNGGEIEFKKLIVATHFPIYNKHGSYFLKMYQHRSYVLALKGAQKMEGMYVDEADKGLSFRPYRDLLLLGGGGHRTGKKGGCWQELEIIAEKYYKGAQIAGRFSAQDCMTLDGIPYVGQYSKNTPDTFVATGFNKWGMTNAMAAADLLCDLVRGRKSPVAEVFSPSRSILHPQIAVNAFESTVGLLTPTSPRCPHLGCALKYNSAEHSWDCPCHGSRFTEDGKLIDTPATEDNQTI